MVWQIVNNVDVNAAKTIPVQKRAPFVEFEGLGFHKTNDPNHDGRYTHPKNDFRLNSVKFVENMPSPRVIKTHLPIEMLPPNILDVCKVVFVCRTPKDCCVSFYNHHMIINEYKLKGTFSDFAELFLSGSVEFGNYWAMLKVIICSNVLLIII